MTNEILDVAVVGGGVSGVYTDWRLLNANRKRRISVFTEKFFFAVISGTEKLQDSANRTKQVVDEF